MATTGTEEPKQLEERLFEDIQSVDGPLSEQHIGMLEQLEDVDARVFRGRTLLHVAVRAGRKDWTGALLARGADPCIRDGDGEDAVRAARVMILRHPGDTGRADILRMVQSGDGAGSTTRGGTAGAYEGRGCGTDTGVMAAVRSLSTKVDTLLKDFSERNILVNKMDERVTSLSQIVTEINTVQMPKIEERMSSISKQVDSAMEECRDTKDKVTELNRVQMSEIEKKITSLVQQVDKFEKSSFELRSTDSKVTYLTTVTREKNTKIGMLLSLLDDMNRCLVNDAMMRVTFIKDQNEEKRERMLRLYGRLQKEGELTSSLLRFFGSGQGVEVHVDMDSDDIGRMKERVRDEDGIEKSGSEFPVHADMEESRVYLGGEGNDEFVSSYLARGLAQMAIHLAFNNGGRPYSEGDTENRTRFQNILGEGMEKKKRGGWNMRLTFALRLETPLGREIRLSIAVPEIIAFYGSAEGTSRLRRHLPSLLTFYEEHVLPALRTGDARV